MIKDREEIIRKAILEKLSSGFDYFTADDILAVAEIDEAQLKEISDSIHVPPPPQGPDPEKRQISTVKGGEHRERRNHPRRPLVSTGSVLRI